MNAPIMFDKETTKWFSSHPREAEAGTTVCRCEKCGLYYKPSLDHNCNAEKTDGAAKECRNCIHFSVCKRWYGEGFEKINRADSCGDWRN